jgi:hypothetical protein
MFLLDEIPVFAKGLNPVFEVEGRSVVMVTQGMAAAPCRCSNSRSSHWMSGARRSLRRWVCCFRGFRRVILLFALRLLYFLGTCFAV